MRKIVVADYSDALTSAVDAFSKDYPDAQVVAIKTDVSNEEQVKALVAGTVEKFGRIDYAVNCAGIGLGAPFAEMPTETWDKTIGVNERGVFMCMREEIAQMIKQDFSQYVGSSFGRWRGGRSGPRLTQRAKDERRKQRGAIVNISSICGLFAIPSSAAYVASKHAVCGLTKAATFEYAGKGIRCNAIAPGWIDTPVRCAAQLCGSIATS